MMRLALRLFLTLLLAASVLAACHEPVTARPSGAVGAGTYTHTNPNITYGPGRINEGGSSSINGSYAQLTFCGTTIVAYYASFNWEQGVPSWPWNGDHSVSMYAGGLSNSTLQHFMDDADDAYWLRGDSLTISGLPPGVHTVTFNNARYFSGFAVGGTCDTVPPTNPTAAETHGVAQNTWQNAINSPTFLLSGASDNQGVAGYNIYFGSNPAGTGASYQTGTTYSPGVVADGVHYLRVRTRDVNDNYAPWVTLFTFRVDVSPPTNPTVTTEASGLLNDRWQNALDSPAFTWSGAADNSSGVAGYHVYWGEDPAGTAGGWQVGDTFAAGVMDDGIYYLRLQTQDVAGNLSGWSNAFTFRLDRQPPDNPVDVSEITGISNDVWQNTLSEPVFTWSGAVDNSSGVAGYHVYWGEDPTGTAGGWQVGDTFAAGEQFDGVKYLRLQTQDVAGNLSSWSDAFTFRYDHQAPDNPVDVSEITGISNGVWQNTLSEPVFTWSGAVDNFSGVAGYHVYWGEDPTGTAAEWQVNDTFAAGVMDDGVYYLRLQTQDVAGNLSDWIDAFTFRLDRQPPDNPVDVSEITGVSSGVWQNYLSEPFFTWSGAADALSGVSGYHIYFGVDPQGTSLDWQVENTFGTVRLPDGEYFLRLQTGDVAGNLSEWMTAFVFRFDSLPPGSVFLDPPDHGTKLIGGVSTLWGTSRDGETDVAQVELSLDNGISWLPLVLEENEWRYAWDTHSVPDGWYDILARATDLAGNLEHTARTQVLIANGPPIVEIPERWLIWEEAPLNIEEQNAPLARVTVLVIDPKERWPALERHYPSGSYPHVITWNRRFADGTLAPVGEYRVLVEAQDVLGNKGVDEGRLLIPLPPLLPQPSPTPLPVLEEPEEQSMPEPSPIPPQVMATIAPTAVIAAPELPPPPQPEQPPPLSEPFPIWQTFGLGGLLAGLAAASLADPRPAALRRMQTTIAEIAQQQKIMMEE